MMSLALFLANFENCSSLYHMQSAYQCFYYIKKKNIIYKFLCYNAIYIYLNLIVYSIMYSIKDTSILQCNIYQLNRLYIV